MARVSLSGLLSSISGSVGSACFRNSPSGHVLYNRPLPSQRGSAPQHATRALISAAATAWGLLDDDIQRSWSSLAKQEHIPTFFSRGRRWTGRQLFTCFYVHAEQQLTPLPARWLPTPPIFWPDPWIQCSLFSPRLVEPDPWDPDPFVPYWVSYSSFHMWRPVTLNPIDPGGTASDMPESFFVGITPKGSTTPPRSMSLLWCSHLVPRPQPPSSSYIAGSDHISHAEPLYSALRGLPPGLTWNMSTPITRTHDFWFSIFGMSDERLYFSGLVNIGCEYSALSPSPSPDTWICAPDQESYTVAFLAAASATYPKTEV